MQTIDSSKVGQATVIGLVGFYFKDSEFKDLMFIQVGEKSKLMDKSRINTASQQIHSVRWMGNLLPPQTGEYKLSTSFNNNVIMQINGETVINQSSIEKSLQLEKYKVYEIKVEFRNSTDTIVDLQLFWSIEDAPKVKIPEACILSPNFAEKANVLVENDEQPFFPNNNLFDRQQENGQKQSVSAPVDSDNDGIPDEWEEKGYTFKDNQIVAWNDSFSALGYRKYVSNPRNARTARDPYTDFEKVTGHMPAATKDEARDPLVAAYPAVGVGMEKLHFSKNDNVGEGIGGTKSKTVTKTDTTTNTVEGGGTIGWGEKGFSLSFSAKYSHAWSNSTSTADTDSTSWSSQIGINTAERAYLNANVRYYNAGSAPIYELRPTSNFVFQNSGDSITTITAGPNQIGNSLGPGTTYPQKGLAPISLDKANETGVVKISINAEQLDKLQEGTETLNLETTQNRGQYATLDATGTPVTDPSKQWDPIRTNIDAVSGSLTLNLGAGKESLERRVAAKNVNDPEDKTPEITIKEAIKKAFNAKEKDNRLYYTNQDGKDIFIHESAINLIADENTKKEIETQLSQMQDKKIYNVKWKRGMKITLHVPTAYHDFEPGHETWYYTYIEDGGYSGKKQGQINASGENSNGFTKLPQLKPNTNYTARAYMRTASATGSNDVVFYVDNNTGAGQGAKVSGRITGNQWKLVEFSFHTGENPEYFQGIGLENKGNSNLHFDDVSVTEWKPAEDIKKTHVLEQWDIVLYYGSHYLNGVTFKNVPNRTVRYQLRINGVDTVILPASPTDAQGKRYVRFTDFNANSGIPEESRIEVYAVDALSDHVKVKIAEYIPLSVGHIIDRWNIVTFNGAQYVNGVTLRKVSSRIVRYQLSIKGIYTVIRPGNPTDAQGNRYVNFLEFNAGQGIPITSRLQFFVVDEKVDSLKYRIGTQG
ncbi:binary toxin-like calcium binding domain-containing protein [Bacillus cereus]|uniref:Iota toxin protein Ib n=1 Tax=Bacillus cereus TaxID=1396 RepID=A0A2B9DI00_BACCE|nr:binary toxin-like calcium binding domain-containing protein [Bacillus cereus]PGM87622.1 Iota toxin protein Ib [Bacillus cereus]